MKNYFCKYIKLFLNGFYYKTSFLHGSVIQKKYTDKKIFIVLQLCFIQPLFFNS